MQKNRFIVVAAACAAIGVAGCGGSSNKALSYSDFSKKANEICKTENVKIKATSAKLTGVPANDAPIWTTLVPQLQAASDKIAALKPPDQLKATFDEFNSINDQQIAGAKKAEAAAKAGDQATYIAAVKAGKPLGQQSDLAASKLGAIECTK
jgi:hypothetical protein